MCCNTARPRASAWVRTRKSSDNEEKHHDPSQSRHERDAKRLCLRHVPPNELRLRGSRRDHRAGRLALLLRLGVRMRTTVRLPASVRLRALMASDVRATSRQDDASSDPESLTTTSGLAPEVVRVLVDNHARFLAFLERRVASRDIAEEILGEAFVRSLQRGGSLRDDESAVAWFYRTLRNAIIDHYRRSDAERRALELVARETETVDEASDADLFDVVCACIGSLVGTLKPEHEEAVRRVDLDGLSVQQYAASAGITANNAGVRLHRAREALRRQVAVSCGTCATHGCLDCTCGAGHSKG